MSRSTLTPSTSSLSLGSGGPLPPPPARPSAVRITIPETSSIVDPHGKQHVVYTVRIRAPGLDRQVMKKFSEFRAFDIVWRSKYPSVSITLPPRVWLQSNKSEKVVAERRTRLEAYLNGLAEIGSVVPYLARFLGVAVDVLRPSRSPQPGASDFPPAAVITHHHRRSSAPFSTIGSAISLTHSEPDSEISPAPPPPPPPSRPPPEDERRPADPKSAAAIRRTESSYLQTVSDYTQASPPPPPLPPPPPPHKGVLAEPVDFHGVLLMALEAVLAPGGTAPGTDYLSLADESDLDGVLDRDWDAAADAVDHQHQRQQAMLTEAAARGLLL